MHPFGVGDRVWLPGVRTPGQIYPPRKATVTGVGWSCDLLSATVAAWADGGSGEWHGWAHDVTPLGVVDRLAEVGGG